MDWVVNFARNKKRFVFGRAESDLPDSNPTREFFKIRIKKRTAVVGLSTMMKRLVSLANKRILDTIFLTIS